LKGRARDFLQDEKHLAHGCDQADDEGAADDAVADVQLGQMRHREQDGQVLVVEAVAGVDAQTEGMSLDGGGSQALEFLGALVFAMEIFRERTGVQFDELRATRAAAPLAPGRARQRG